ncbi:MAG: SIS domain-containing protein [Bacteriovoracia bacterium]
MMTTNSNYSKESDTALKKSQIDELVEAKKVLETEARCIIEAKDRLGPEFSKGIDLIDRSLKKGGKVIVLGLGKSGKIAAKIAATLSSTGTPAIFLHPTEGAHGDLGLVQSQDVVLALSYSGNSDEILRILPNLKSRSVPIICIVGNTKSVLARQSDVVIDGSVSQEACSLNLAPTSSTSVALSLGDAFAVVLSLRYGFKEEQFANHHPAGALGRRLTLKVRDLMKSEKDLPWVAEDASMEDLIEVSTQKRLGAAIVHPKGTVSHNWVGIVTDGDIRRALKHKDRFFSMKASEIMTVSPVTIHQDEKAIQALELMENRPNQISVLPVLDDQKNCVGLVRLHDLVGSL